MSANLLLLQFCSFPSFFGRIIPWFTQAADGVGHVDLVLPNGTLLGAQHEAGLGDQPAGVQIRPPDYGGMVGKVRVALPVTTTGYVDAMKFAHAQIGKPYDTADITAFVVGRRLSRQFLGAADWRDESSWFCSELQARVAEVGKAFRYLLASPDYQVTPGGLLLACSAIAPAIKVRT
jgi:hypothetical protein